MHSAECSVKNGPVEAHENKLDLLTKAADFAAKKHRCQRRKDGKDIPYINHPIGVAHLLTSIGNVFDPEVLAAAYLHDTVEDTDTTYEELALEFGQEVADIVRECTDDKALPKKERKRLQLEKAAGLSQKAKLVKLADKLYNLSDLECVLPIGWTEARLNDYFLWGRDVVDQLRGTNESLEKALDEVFSRHFAEGTQTH